MSKFSGGFFKNKNIVTITRDHKKNRERILIKSGDEYNG